LLETVARRRRGGGSAREKGRGRVVTHRPLHRQNRFGTGDE
jgi:hypothetical protein